MGAVSMASRLSTGSANGSLPPILSLESGVFEPVAETADAKHRRLNGEPNRLVQGDPVYQKWKVVLYRLPETKAAVEGGDASAAGLSAAQAEYDRICVEIDEIDSVTKAS
jgi:hypothetical protein